MTTDTTQTPVAVPSSSAQTLAEEERSLAGDLLGEVPSTSDGDELDRQLAAPPASARARRATAVIAVVLVGAVGFLGGVWLQHARGVGSTSAAASGFAGGGSLPSGFPSGGPGGGAAGAGIGAGIGGQGTPLATGTVKLVDGKVVYVATGSGVVKVLTTSSTRVTTTSLAGLAAGSTVSVYGTQASDGTVTASAIATSTTTGSSSAAGATPTATPTS